MEEITTQSIADASKAASKFLDEAVDLSNVFVSVAGTAGIAGFVFDIVEDEVVELGSYITDHYVETGSPVQDHIALKPERITVRGLMGEYKHIISGKQSFLEKATQKLVTLSTYLTPLSNAANSIYNTLNDTKSLSDLSLESIGGLGMDLFKAYRDINIPQNEQQKAFIYFEGLRNARTTFTIQTPFRYYTDMAIETIRARQAGNTVDLSNFEVTFKKIRYVNTDIISAEEKEKETPKEQDIMGRLKEQASAVVDKGMNKLQEVKESVTTFVGGLFGEANN